MNLKLQSLQSVSAGPLGLGRFIGIP